MSDGSGVVQVHAYMGGTNGWCTQRLADGSICGGRPDWDVHRSGPKRPPLRTDPAARLDAIKITFTEPTGLVNLWCVAHPWWARDQVQPDFQAVWKAIAVHVCMDHEAG